jgi:superfamily II DNA or RNA helicase
MAGKFYRCLPYSCLFVVDQIDLLYQNRDEIQTWLGEEVGYVGDQKFELRRVTVATIQTLHKHRDDFKFRKWYSHVMAVVVDELHEQMARRNFDVLTTINPIARYGLTATLQLKKKDIRTKAHSFAGPILYEFPIEQGMKQGVLTKGQTLQLLFEPVPIAHEEYQEQIREQVIENEQKQKAVKAIVQLLLQNDRYVVILVDRVEHLERLSDLMDDIPHRLAYGRISVSDRISARKKFEKGKINLLIANKVFKKGINLKRVDCIIDMAEMKSKNDVMQKFGRGVRLHEDKDALLYIDIGTQGGLGGERFRKAATSRIRALRAANIPCRSVKVSNLAEALKAVKKELKGEEQLALKFA